MTPRLCAARALPALAALDTSCGRRQILRRADTLLVERRDPILGGRKTRVRRLLEPAGRGVLVLSYAAPVQQALRQFVLRGGGASRTPSRSGVGRPAGRVASRSGGGRRVVAGAALFASGACPIEAVGVGSTAAGAATVISGFAASGGFAIGACATGATGAGVLVVCVAAVLAGVSSSDFCSGACAPVSRIATVARIASATASKTDRRWAA